MFPATTSVRVDLGGKIDGIKTDGGTCVEDAMALARSLLDKYRSFRSGCQEYIIYIGDGDDYDAMGSTSGTARKAACGYWDCCPCGDNCCYTCWIPCDKQDYEYEYMDP